APNNLFRPMNEQLSFGPTPGALGTQGNNGGANDELYSFHTGGCNVLLGDGSVRFIKSTVNIVTLRGLVTLKGGEVISADSYLTPPANTPDQSDRGSPRSGGLGLSRVRSKCVWRSRTPRHMGGLLIQMIRQ